MVENHLNYNIASVRFCEGICLSVFAFRLTQDDFGIRFNNYPRLNWAIARFFLLFRVLIAVYLLWHVIPNGLYMIWQTFALCYLNNPIRMYDFLEPSEIGYINMSCCYCISILVLIAAYFMWVFIVCVSCLRDSAR